MRQPAADVHSADDVATFKGLHFTPEALTALEDTRGHTLSRVTLHVGAGTFKPVQGNDIAAHDMHTEIFEVDRSTIEGLHASLLDGQPIVPVGTTTVRVLESLYWIGVRTLLQSQRGQQGSAEAGQLDEHAENTEPPQQHLSLGQWEPMELEREMLSRRACDGGSGGGGGGGNMSRGDAADASSAAAAAAASIPPAEALGALLALHDGGTYRGSTSICIAPGYTFAMVDALVTNFHQPGSTLLYLTAALLGGTDRLFDAYAHAVEQEYMFLSYGDACLIVNHQQRDGCAPTCA